MKTRPTRQFMLQHPARVIALGAGAGLAAKAPGTWGTLVAFPIYFVTFLGGGSNAVLITAILLFGLGIWAAAETGRALGVADHGSIVIDEIAAFLLVLAFTPATLMWALIAFVLFRVFDIVKPWPIRLADRTIKGGFGVMFDDFLAAVFTLASLWFLRSIFEGMTP
jgi:phosphatidylglycerophosphatase A